MRKLVTSFPLKDRNKERIVATVGIHYITASINALQGKFNLMRIIERGITK